MSLEVDKPSRRCHITARELKPGECYWSALIETPSGQQRLDFSVEHWSGPPENAIGYWRGRLPTAPVSTTARQVVSVESMRAALDNWIDSSDPLEKKLCYVLALLLMRRKALKLQDVEQIDGNDWLLIRPVRSKTIYRIADPQLSDDEASQLEDEVIRRLELQAA